MIHQSRNKKEKLRYKKITKYLVIFGILLIFSILGGLTLFGKLTNYFGLPIWKAERIVTENIYNKDYIIHTKKSLFKENENLLKENEDLKISMLNYSILEKENTELKELLNRLPESTNFILANILTKPNHSPYDTIIVDVGENKEIEEGDRVYANGDVPIGVVSKVYGQTSLITLYSSPNQRTTGIIDGSKVNVELVGRGGGNFEIIVPIDLPSTEGTMVLLPGLRPEVLAYMEKIISTPTDPIKKILLKSPINVQNLKWVEIKRN